MKLTRKDSVGLALVIGTLGALLLHNSPTPHRASHVDPIVDAGGSVTSAAASAVFAFVDVNVVPMDENRVVRHQIVVVRDGFVERIGRVGVVEPPAGARIIEGGGTKYVAPGLTDAHVHLGDDAEKMLPLFLANGVTTVFNLEGDPSHLDLRDDILAGDVVGPTLYTAGPFLDEGNVRTPADARSAVASQKALGFDFVKVHGNLSSESFAALSATGREHDIAVVGHAPRNLPFSAVLENRQASVTHAEELIYTKFMELDPRELDGVAAEMVEAGTWLTPGMVHFQNVAAQWGDPEGLEAALAQHSASFLPPSLLLDWRASNEWIDRDPGERARILDMAEFHGPLLQAFHDAGVPMLTGTDTPLPGMVPGFSLHDEIVALREVGFSGYDAFSAATLNAGIFIRDHVDEHANFGTVRVGARADLLLLDDDPRRSVDALRAPRGVMVRGKWLDRGDLDRLLRSAGTTTR